MSGTDDAELWLRLRRRLQAADPAADLAPAATDEVARLLEDTMNADDTSPTADNADVAGSRPARRSPVTWVAAAAAAAVIAGAGAFALSRGGDGSTPPTAQEPAPTTATLSAGPEVAGKCAMPTAEILGLQDTAFDGTVVAVSDDEVTLDVGQWYRGGDAERVSVQGPPAELDGLLLAVDFQVGRRYLVSAVDGRVSLCGLSAAYSEDLASLYAQAFAG